MSTVLATLSLLACGGGGPAVQAPSAADFAALDAAGQRDLLLTTGKRVYEGGGLACVTCHGPDGKGQPGSFPPLVGQRDHMGDCVKHAAIVVHGLSGELVVDGVTYNGAMPALGDLLSDVEIASVVSYVRTSWGNDFGLCSPDDVAKARAGGR
jgi:nitrite reductase (NO-forming)